ncbi:HTTM domain-containing protein [bacterium]|nr:HTTM domain-containing protein [bacterium]
MNLDAAMRMTEILLALAFLQQSAEHFASIRERRLFLPRLLLSALLLAGVQTPWVLIALVAHALAVLRRFQGPYNGGSDRMSLLILCCLCLARFVPAWQEYAFGYLAVQVVLSYFMAGWVKIVNPEWRSGQALRDVFLFSAYPASESLRGWAENLRLLWAMSWAVMLFELLFPLTLLTPFTLMLGLTVAATFHLANACLFGLNRFFWCWLAAYPSLLWLQQRMFM